MNNVKPYITVMGAMAAVLLSAGCAKEKGSNSVATTPVSTCTTNCVAGDDGTPTTPDSDLSGYNDASGLGTNEAAWDYVNSTGWAHFTDFVHSRPLNNPTDLRLKLDLADHGGGKFGGTVRVTYKDNGQVYGREFTAQDITLSVSNKYFTHNGKKHAEYNRWFTRGGTEVFRGFFDEKNKGAIMILVTSSSGDQGDGAGARMVTGEIWYKNHVLSTQFWAAPLVYQTDVPCWFIENGPFDCRTSLLTESLVAPIGFLRPTESTGFNSTANVAITGAFGAGPERGWKKLGNFYDLNRLKAFGLE